jgi:hypothetical protein
VPAGTVKASAGVSEVVEAYGTLGDIKSGAEDVPILSDFTEKMKGERNVT